MQTMHRKFASLFYVLFFGLTSLLASTGKRPPLYITQNTDIVTEDGTVVTLRAGTQVVVEAAQSYNAKNLSVGQTISVRCKFNVVVDKKTAISAGSLGSATISNLDKPKGFGRGGSIEFQVQSVQAVDGQQVLLSGIPLNLEGDDKKGLAIGLAIGLGIVTLPLLCVGALGGFLIKGKHAALRAGTTINSSIASDIDINIEPK